MVTTVLAKSFVEHGHQVTIVTFKPPSPLMRQRLDDRIAFYVLSGYHVGHGNVATLRGILTSRHIEVVINQWGLPFFSSFDFEESGQGAWG